MSLDASIGVLIGSGISITVTYLNNRWTEKRESHKTEIERQNEAISEFYSPLTFILQKARNLFVIIATLREAIPRIQQFEKGENIPSVLSYLVAGKAASHIEALEDLLYHKSDLAQPSELCTDLGILQNYLSSILQDVYVVIRTEKDLAKLDHYLSGLAPVIVELDNAISQMRIYALAQVARLPKQKYNQFFTEGKHSELENLLDKAFLTIGIEVPDWASVLKGSR